jgi:hypothetical protein
MSTKTNPKGVSPIKAAAIKAAAKSAAKKASKPAPAKSKPAAKKPEPAKARRLEEIAESKKGLFAIDPTLLSIEPGFNERINYGDIDQLADDIAANGLETPFKIRKLEGSETIFIVHGHRRHRAITEKLIPQGRWHNEDGSVKPVDCYAEARGTTDFDRLAGQLSSNTGLAYNLLEKAAGYKRLLEMDDSLKPADLARRFGESKQAVSDALRLSREGSAKLHKAILNGTMAASTAIAIIKQAGTDHAAQDALLASALTASNGTGHVMPKHIPSADPPKQNTGSSGPTPANTYIDPNPGDDEDEDEDPSDQSDPSAFKLYIIDDAPEEPIAEGSPFYNETDRFVLTHPEKFNVERLHLLCASTSFGAAYGFRVDDHEHLPDISAVTLDCEPREGLVAVLESACRHAQLSTDQQDDLQNLLYDALDAYYPETGTPKEPERLPFARASQSRTGSANPGFQKTLNSSGGSGGGGGGGKSTYIDPQTFKAVQKIEDVLEALADEEEDEDKGIKERVTAVEIALGVLRNERPASDLKNYLLGK